MKVSHEEHAVMRQSFCSASDLDTIEELVGGLSSTSEEDGAGRGSGPGRNEML